MPAVFWMSTLRSGVRRDAYERWVREFDYIKAGMLSSILSYHVYRIEAPFLDGVKAFDYLEVIEVTSLDEYRKEIAEHPAAEEIRREWGTYVDLVGSLAGEVIPSGVRGVER